MSKPSITPDDAKAMKAVSRDLEPLFRYRYRVTNDPLRLSILAAHALIDEMIELVIAEAVPNSECFEVPKMQFWKKLKIVRTLAPSDGGPYSAGYKVLWRCIEKLTNLRNAAAHKDYEILRDERFTDLAEFFYPDAAFRTARSRELLLQESTEICAGMLMGMRHNFERHRQGSQDAKGAPERTNQ